MDSQTKELLTTHFQEDRDNFHSVNQRSDRFEQLLGQMGEHLSFLRKDMNVIAETQTKHAGESEIFRKEMRASIEKIEKALNPIQEERATDEAVDKRNKRYAENVLLIVKLIVGISAACTTVWAVFKYIIFQAIQK